MKIKEKIEARRIRVKEQLSLKDISLRLGVAKSTASLWLRDLPLSQKTVKKRHIAGQIKAAKNRTIYSRQKRLQQQYNGRYLASLHKDNPLFMAGCMMHWAEGSKHKNTAAISNMDSHFLCLWLKFMKQFFSVRLENVALHIQCHPNNGKTLRQIESYWLKQLNLPQSSLTKTSWIKKHWSSSGKANNRHPYGVVKLSIYSTEIVQNIWGAIKFFADIEDQEKWLD